MTRWRGLLAAAVAVLALALFAVWLPRPDSQAAQGQKWLTGVHWAGFLLTNTQKGCSVTVVSEWMAITAKHCGTVNPRLVLNLSALSEPNKEHAVKEIHVNRDWDVQAIFLKNRTGLTVTPLRASVDRAPFYAWGYGDDWSNNFTAHLTRAEFSLPQLCPAELFADEGNLCFQTDAKNSVCRADSGGPITQNGAIIAMQTSGRARTSGDCRTMVLGQALTVQQMQPWLDNMIREADPFD